MYLLQQYFMSFCLFRASLGTSKDDREYVVNQDILFPYDSPSAIELLRSHDRHRVTRECQPEKFGDFTYEVYPAHYSVPRTLPIVESRPFVQKVGRYYWDQTDVTGHYFAVHHPEKTFSVLEPSVEGGCNQKAKSTVAKTSKNYKQNCIIATNAGFFVVEDGTCLGDLVSDGREAVNTQGVQNAHFGITKSGDIFVGYLPRKSHLEETFSQLITGILWLVRNGESYMDVSMKTECPDHQTAGSMQYFADVKSARLAIGHDKDGRIVIVQVDGRTGQNGITLWELTDLLISWGVVNAINLDGGGSVTTLINDTWVNSGGDDCKKNGSFPETYRCQRELTSVLCVHEPLCSPEDCNGHGDCIVGQCQCHGNWVGSVCNELQCGVLNCTRHGLCTPDGCVCQPGWYDEECSTICSPGKYGLNCSADCQCHNGGTCLPQDGTCICPPGYTGDTCQQECPYGRYGQDCRQICYCKDSCICDRATGACDVSLDNYSNLLEAAQCLSNHEVTVAKQVATFHHDKQYRMWLITVIVISLLAAGSLVLNIVLLCRLKYARSSHCHEKVRDLPKKLLVKRKKKYQPKRPLRNISESSSPKDSDEENCVPVSQNLETRVFLSQVGERRTSSDNTDAPLVKSPKSQDLSLQPRAIEPPDITKSLQHREHSAASGGESSDTLTQRELGEFLTNERTLNKYRDLLSLIDL